MKKLIFTTVAALLSTASFATIPDITIDGSVSSQITVYDSEQDAINVKNGTAKALQVPTHQKEISYMHVSLSPRAKAYLSAAAEKYIKNPSKCTRDDQMQVGMGIVPVFDQGGHGSCVTFAITAALDAAYGVGDYISQLCNLELGSYLNQQNRYYPSGWDGSYNDTVFGQIKQYGVITMTSQLFEGCSGKYIYPKDAYTSVPLSVEDFKKRSVDTFANIVTKDALSINDSFNPNVSRDAVVENIKKILKAGHRVVIATLIDGNLGGGCQGQYSIFANDSWILTPTIAAHLKHGMINSAHDVIITGFDDQAVIEGPDGLKQQGVFTIRNSWGLLSGNFGTFYMSYDYFKVMVFEAIEVI